MKKIFIACLIVLLTSTIVDARPIHGRHNGFNKSRHGHTTIIKKRDRSANYVALGVTTGLLGLIIGNNIANNSYVAPREVRYVEPQPVIIPAPTPIRYVEPQPVEHCVTRFSPYGERITTCTSY